MRASSARRLPVPALERYLEDSRPWGLEKRDRYGFADAYEAQRTDPRPDGLLDLLGIDSGDQVLVVAGHRGTWARALARAGAKVTYSDLSTELTAYARRHVKHRNITAYHAASYVTYPAEPGTNDWTFTFEAVGPRHFVLLRSLLNRKGGKFVIWERGGHSRRKRADLTRTLAALRRLYSVRATSALRALESADRKGRTKERLHRIFTVLTNEVARENASLDLRLFQLLYRRKKLRLGEAAMVLGCDARQLSGALRRLSEWRRLSKPKYAKKVRLL